MRARTFYFVCAGILCLALAYHVGARKASAQSGLVSTASVNETYYIHVAVVDRTVYLAYMHNVPGTLYPPQSLPPVPGAGAIVSITATNGPVVAILDNGDVYDY